MKICIIIVSAFVHIYKGVFLLLLAIIDIGNPFNKLRIVCVFMVALLHNFFYCEGYLELKLVKVYDLLTVTFILTGEATKIRSVCEHKISKPNTTVP